jgi:hypothetical protein
LRLIEGLGADIRKVRQRLWKGYTVAEIVDDTGLPWEFVDMARRIAFGTKPDRSSSQVTSYEIATRGGHRRDVQRSKPWRKRFGQSPRERALDSH